MHKPVNGMILSRKFLKDNYVLGPVLINIFINDLFHFVTSRDLYNYADDNSLAASDNGSTIAIYKLTEGCEAALTWFKIIAYKQIMKNVCVFLLVQITFVRTRSLQLLISLSPWLMM